MLRTTWPGVRAALVCLKASFPGPATLEFALVTLPTDPSAYAWNLRDGDDCLLRVVAERAAEDPRRARDVLLRAAFSDNGTTRGIVLSGLERIDLPDMPARVVTASASEWDHERMFAVSAALALNALERAPTLVERAALDRYQGVSSRAHRLLVKSPKAAAPRLIARLLVRHPGSSEAAQLLSEREARAHDVTPALIVVRSQAAAALMELESRRARGAKRQMGSLE
jgi:hypothetical protein